MRKKTFLFVLASCLTTGAYAHDAQKDEEGTLYQETALYHDEKHEDDLSCLCPGHEDDDEENNFAKCSCEDKKPEHEFCS
ncbi:MAG: hypothetical protein CK425_08775 [Parachlamydia sp.]|nr:MAG: hypothetical protein CK425_08775 [Parachlamydia sp.]